MKKIITLILFLFILLFPNNNEADDNFITITTYNPYMLRVRLEVKCDFRNGDFTFHKFFHISSKDKTIISMPNNFKDCQIWPYVIFF